MPEKHDRSVLGELLGLLAHDLRNPLSALHSNLGFLRSVSEPGNVDAREAIDDGLVSCDGLAHIIDNIELLGQALRGADRAEGTILAVEVLAAEVASDTRAMAQSHGVGVVASLPEGAGPTAHGARDLLARALGNLVRNSIQHAPSGSQVQISLRSEPGHEIVVVADSGAPLGGGGSAFTAEGQVSAKSGPHGRYSRGLGLYAAALAAAAGNATIRTAPPPPGCTNAFELVLAARVP